MDAYQRRGSHEPNVPWSNTITTSTHHSKRTTALPQDQSTVERGVRRYPDEYINALTMLLLSSPPNLGPDPFPIFEMKLSAPLALLGLASTVLSMATAPPRIKTDAEQESAALLPSPTSQPALSASSIARDNYAIFSSHTRLFNDHGPVINGGFFPSSSPSPSPTSIPTPSIHDRHTRDSNPAAADGPVVHDDPNPRPTIISKPQLQTRDVSAAPTATNLADFEHSLAPGSVVHRPMADGPLAAVNATTTPTTTSTTAQRLKKKNLCWTPWPCDPWTSTTAAADGERAVNPAAMEPDMPRPVEKEAGSLMPVLEPRKGGGGHGGSFSSSSSSGGRGGSSSSS
ncbi:hypothetical protein LTS18_004364, partial [Coniosporium uncinatum]